MAGTSILLWVAFIMEWISQKTKRQTHNPSSFFLSLLKLIKKLLKIEANYIDSDCLKSNTMMLKLGNEVQKTAKDNF